MSKKICKYSIITVISVLFLISVLIFVTVYLNSEILRITFYTDPLNKPADMYYVFKIYGDGEMKAVQFYESDVMGIDEALIPDGDKCIIEEGNLRNKKVKNYGVKKLSFSEMNLILWNIIKLNFMEIHDNMGCGNVFRAIISVSGESHMHIYMDENDKYEKDPGKTLNNLLDMCIEYSPIEIQLWTR